MAGPTEFGPAIGLDAWLNRALFKAANPLRGGGAMQQDYIDRFKKYVPSEVLAAFVALDALMPLSRTGTWIYLGAGAAVTLLFIIYAITTKMFKNPMILFIVSLSVPLWAVSSATIRLEQEYGWFETAKIMILAILVIVSLALTLFAPAPPSAQDGAPPPREG